MDEEFPVASYSQIETILKEQKDEWHWAKQPSGSISLPDFIQLRAKGEAKTHNGHVYLKKPGPDPEMQALLVKRMNDAFKVMEKNMTKNLYGDDDPVDHPKGLAALFSKRK